MSQFKKQFKKTWIIAAAAALIVGSTSAMAYALNSAVPDTALKSAVTSAPSLTVSPQDTAASPSQQPGYTVNDRSKEHVDFNEFKDELKNKSVKYTAEEIEKFYQDYLINTTPGDKDMTADQAAAYAAKYIQTAYGVDLTGFSAEASFSKCPLPYTDNWGIIFHAPNETDSTFRYIVDINSVTGELLDVGTYNMEYRDIQSKDLDNPIWVTTAEQNISKLLPAGVTITGSKVVYATESVGVTVVCSLSDGSAFAVRLVGDEKTAQVYINFPNGYDGSLDYKPLSAEGVG